ncbi:hypothetical protein E8E12_005554 [Didymella heteroderae]|uniref:Uncharacterized protein n=1 Tax=Didymella heteroderae TaxID=1769908 RepID=A0A9P4WNX5_9PLEO|nr:hypothetical protein E8E12_005554 [Didymella heteroderae]
MVQHVIKPQQARYILDRQDLLGFLKGKFDSKYPNHDFKIVHKSDRWTFDAPETVNSAEIDDLVKRIADKNANN